MSNSENNYISGGLKCHHEITVNPDPSFFYMHAHDVCELFYFINGDANYYVEGNVYKLQKGDIMIMRQCETHKMQISPDCVYERISVHFSPAIIYETLSENILRPFYLRPLGRMNLYRKEDFLTDHYLSCINAICRCIDKKMDNEYIIAHLMSLLIEICDAYDNKDLDDLNTQTEDTAINMVDYINKHIFDKISLSSIAEKFFISNSQANRIFKKSIGSSIWEYVTIKRLMAARDMIFDGLNPQFVAEKCGFSDYSSFYRAYKKKFGTNPKSDYNKNKLVI